MRWRELGDQECSVARTVSVIGDRWTLLVLRECFLRVRRFEQFQERLGITRPVLAERLQKLVEAGVLEKVAYQERPLRQEYRLTPRGLDLYPVMMAIVHWGDVHMAKDGRRPLLHRHQPCGHLFDPVMVCSECTAPLNAREVTVEPGPRGDTRASAEPAREPAARHRAKRSKTASPG
jgi:DNA-binding HxlR family transcriptional regulator